MTDTYDYLGAGILAPFRRDGKDDFANGAGIEVVESSLLVIMGTRCAGPSNDGEVPWNQKLGTLLPLLRHRNIDDLTTEELGRFYTIDSITKNEPRIKAKAVGFGRRPDDNKIVVRLKYDVVDRDTTGINVIASDIEQEIDV